MGELEALSGAGGAGIVPGNYLKPKLNGFLSKKAGAVALCFRWEQRRNTVEHASLRQIRADG